MKSNGTFPAAATSSYQMHLIWKGAPRERERKRERALLFPTEAIITGDKGHL